MHGSVHPNHPYNMAGSSDGQVKNIAIICVYEQDFPRNNITCIPFMNLDSSAVSHAVVLKALRKHFTFVECTLLF